MSAKFKTLKNKWDMGYITIETLKRWVAINKKRPGNGITEEEYKKITGYEYK